MKNKKRFLSVLLALVLLCVGVPLTAAEDEMTYQVGDHIQFGTYPQTRVDETPELKAAADAATWKSYDYYTGTGDWDDGLMEVGNYMRFADFFCNGEKYRAVFFSSYRPIYTGYTSSPDHSYQDNNGYILNITYYFRYEPLIWRVLDPSVGYIICESVIDSQPFQNVVFEDYQGIGSSSYANKYSTSSIREWLNFSFFETAFADSQKAFIQTSELNNDSYKPNYTQYSSSMTIDKIFLISYADAINSAYGFSNNPDNQSVKRIAQGTDYAKCQGLRVCNTAEYYKNSTWKLRTPSAYSFCTCYVQDNGIVTGNDSKNVFCTYEGIRPACVVTNIKNDVSISEFLFSAGTYQHLSGEPVHENELLATCAQEGRYEEVIYCTECGAELSREAKELSALGHVPQTHTTASTCAENGFTITICTRCGETLSSEILPRLDHTWDDGIVTQEPTCDTLGVKTYTCSGCDETYTEPIDLLEHTWDGGAVTKQPSCTEAGVLTYTCADCGATKTETIDKLDHVFVLIPGKASTCTEDGLTDGWKCDSCGKVFLEQQTIEALGHDHQIAPYVPATCTEDGYAPFICTRCGDTIKTDPETALGHKYEPVYVWAKDDKTATASLTCARCGDVTLTETVEVETAITVKPTCSTEGELTMIAAFNNKAFYAQTKTKVLPIDPDAHVFRVTVTPPTCLDDGYTSHACTLCRYGYSDGIVDALGHDWDDGEVTLAPTCTTTGTMCFTCKREGCVETMEKKLPANPDMHVLEATVHAPTCTEEGYTAHLCQNCKYGYTDAHVDALGHDYQHHDAKAPTCQEPGWAAYDTCSRCDYTTYQELATVGHSDDNNDGYCDLCGEMMQGGEHCNYCGQIHDGPFGWLVKIFHNILAIFKR